MKMTLPPMATKIEIRFGGGWSGLSEADQVVFRGNVFGPAGRDALHLKGTTDVDARQNFWGPTIPPSRIHDREDDAGLGSASWAPALSAPPSLDLPEEAW